MYVQELERKFSKYGRVREARVVRDNMTGESRGFGFVIMSAEDEVDEVCVVAEMFKSRMHRFLACLLISSDVATQETGFHWITHYLSSMHVSAGA